MVNKTIPFRNPSHSYIYLPNISNKSGLIASQSGARTCAPPEVWNGITIGVNHLSQRPNRAGKLAPIVRLNGFSKGSQDQHLPLPHTGKIVGAVAFTHTDQSLGA